MVQAAALIHALLELGVCKSDDLDEAQARQLIYGGSLELNLLELLAVDEAGLLRALAHECGGAVAAPGPLLVERSISTAVRSVHREAVAGFAADGTVVVSVAGPPTQEEHLAFVAAASGRPVSIQVTTGLRLLEALALLDGSLLGRRVEEQLARSARPSAQLQDGPPPLPSLRVDPEPEPLPAVPPPLVPGAQPADSSLSELSRLVIREAPAAVLEHHVAVSSAVTPAPEHKAADETAPPPAGYQELARSVIPPPPLPERIAVERTPAQQDPLEHVTQPTGAEDVPSDAAHPPFTAGSQPSSRPEPAYPQRQALLDLATAKDRDGIVSTLSRFCAQFFEYVAVFGIQASEARGLTASGPGKSSERIHDLRVPLDVPSALSRVRDTGQHRVARLRAGGLEGGLVRDLERPLGRAVLLLPITVQGRTLLLIWADDGPDDVDIEHALPALGLVRVAAAALERVLIERKRASRLARPSLVPGAQSTTAEAAPEEKSPPPAAEAPPPVLPGVPEVAPAVPSPAASRASAPPAAAVPAEPTFDTRPTRLGMSIPPAGVRRMSSAPAPRPEVARKPPLVDERHETKRDLAPPEARPSSPTRVDQRMRSEAPKKRKLAESFGDSEPSPGPSSTPAGPSDPPLAFPSQFPKTMKGYPGDIRMKASLSPAPKVSAPLLSRRIVAVSEQPHVDPATEGRSTGVAPAAESNASPTSTEASSADTSDTSDVDTNGAGDVDTSASDTPPSDSYPTGTESPSGGTMMSRRLEVDSPAPRISDRPPVRPSPARPSPAPLSYRALVGQWLDGDPAALDRLVEGGESAVGALIAAFPGPVEEPPSPQTRASDCGPVLKAIATIGAKATPFVTVRTADEDSRVRRWAVLLLGELPGRDAARAIADRLLDETVDVRRAALASARRVQADSLTRRTLRARLEEMTRDSQLMTEERCAAIEAIADIREHESIPTLLQLLDDESSAVKRAARWALSVLTRHDFQENIEKWREFWQRHRNEPRSEWLLLALKSTQGDLARAAADEIESTLGSPVGDIEHLTEENIAHLREKLRTRPS